MPRSFLKILFLVSCLSGFLSCEKKPAVRTNLPDLKDALAALGPSAPVDCDLSEMGANMVYAEVFNMMIEPESYNGKSVRMRGNFAVYDNEMTGRKSYAVIVSDALACCQQGIEFAYDFAGKEPEEGGIITVTGIYVSSLLKDDIAYNYVEAACVEMPHEQPAQSEK